MPRNIEVKIRVPEPAPIRAAALAAGARSRGVETQTDRYYELAGGRRVKLRVRDGGTAEMIRYDRPETGGIRASTYEVTPVRDADAGVCAVPKDAPVSIVRKRRELLVIGNVRIHLDDVEGLGTFLELEAVVDPAHDDDAGRHQISVLLDALGLAGAEPIRASYGELVRGAR